MPRILDTSDFSPDAVVGVGGIELIEAAAVGLAHPVDHGVPGEGDQAGGLVHRVVGQHHHGVGIAADLVAGHQQEGIGILLALQLGLLRIGGLPALPGSGGVLRSGGQVPGLLRWPGDDLYGDPGEHDHGGQGHQDAVEHPARPPGGGDLFLLFACAGPALGLRGAPACLAGLGHGQKPPLSEWYRLVMSTAVIQYTGLDGG